MDIESKFKGLDEAYMYINACRHLNLEAEVDLCYITHSITVSVKGIKKVIDRFNERWEQDLKDDLEENLGRYWVMKLGKRRLTNHIKKEK